MNNNHEKFSGTTPKAMDRIGNFFGELNRRDAERGTTRREKLVRSVGTVVVTGLFAAGISHITSMPETHVSGTGVVENPNIDLSGQGTSGDKDFDTAVNLVNAGIADAKEQDVWTDVSQKEREELATTLKTKVAQLDQNPDPNIFSIDESKYNFVVSIENGEATGAQFVAESSSK